MKHVTFIVIFFITISCSNEKNGEFYNKIKINPESSDIFDYSEFYTLDKFIFLDSVETISNIERAELIENYMILFNGRPDFKIIIYNLQNNTHKIIKNKGEGPKEYRSISNFDINPINKKIYILDNMQGKILVYDFDGNLLEAYTSTNLINIYSFKMIDEKNILCYGGNFQFGTSNHRLFLLDLEREKITNTYFKIPEEEKNILLIEGNNFLTNADGLYFTHIYNNAIYQYQEEELISKYEIDFQDAKIPDAYLKDSQLNLMEFINLLNEKNWIHGISNTFFVNKTIGFTFTYKNEMKLTTFNTEKKEINTYASKRNPLLGLSNIYELDYLDVPIATKGNKAVYFIEPDDIINRWVEEKVDNNEYHTDLRNKINRNGNPIIIIYKTIEK